MTILRRTRDSDLGFVYAIQAESGGLVKVGFSAKPRMRLAQLQSAHGELLVIRRKFIGTRDDEERAHRQLAPFQHRGEWFRDEPEMWERLGDCEMAFRAKLRIACALAKLEPAVTREIRADVRDPERLAAAFLAAARECLAAVEAMEAEALRRIGDEFGTEVAVRAALESGIPVEVAS